jgi:hypothetical protein
MYFSPNFAVANTFQPSDISAPITAEIRFLENNLLNVRSPSFSLAQNITIPESTINLEYNSINQDQLILFDPSSLPETEIKLEETNNQSPSSSITQQPTIQEEKPLPPLIPEPVLEPITPETPETSPEATQPTATPEQMRQFWLHTGLESLSSTSAKYPFLGDPSDRLTVPRQMFRPDQDEDYTTIDLRFAENNPILNSFTFAHFPQADQFYWLLEGNRIVMETKGYQGGVFFQGRSSTSHYTQNILSEQRFLGLQGVWTLPQIPKELKTAVANNQVQVLVIAGEIINPEGVLAPEINLNHLNRNDSNINVINVPNLGSGSTNNPEGGGSLFQNLEATNTPKFIQAFPTNNLQPLLNHGVPLREGAIIPLENLEAAHIGFKDPLTGQGFKFAAPLTSLPGLKVGQPEGGMSEGLLNSVVNPFLTPRQRDLAYLDSLWWIPIGQRTLAKWTIQDSRDSDDWYRFYVTRPHKKSLIEYDPSAISLNYQSIFANPGISLTTSSHSGLDSTQMINGSMGLMLGGIFELINNENIENSLAEARQILEQGGGFTTLKTVATAQERRQLNQRLNLTLNNGDRATRLVQLSGNYIFPSTVNLNDSNLFQIRTGLSRRRVEFFSQEIGDFDHVVTFFSKLDIKDFGPLGFIGVLEPKKNTGLNESTAMQVTLIAPNGEKLVQEYQSNSPDNTVIPIMAGKAVDIAFDSIKIAQLLARKVETNTFTGQLFLPTIELVYSGTSDNFNYGLSTGAWFNIDPNQAGVVTNNNFGLTEPNFGIYIHGNANLTMQNVEFNAENKPIAVATHVPFLDFDWNSAINRLNALQISLGYTFSRQEEDLGYSATALLLYSNKGDNSPTYDHEDLVGLLSGQFALNLGFNLELNLQIAQQIDYDFEITQKITDNLSGGVYFRNYNTLNRGLESRFEDHVFGTVWRYILPDQKLMLETQLGNSDQGLDFTLKSSLRFNF